MRVLFIFFFFIFPLILKGQINYFQDTWTGGVTAAGFSTGKGSGSGTFDIYIEPGSTIKKAFLMNFRVGYQEQGTIILNNQLFNFDFTDEINCFNYAFNPTANPICINIKDITN
ncbi:MAG: hypothetical protein H0X62_16930, partial [Bacteroidetes bacterium]|nr:hypothetical protein [Bacteroidota bacterium]